jgi:hypothetical protein
MKNSHKHEKPGKKKIKGRTVDSMRARKISSTFKSANQQNMKVNNAKSKEQSARDSTWRKTNNKTDINEYLSIITLAKHI